MLAQSGACQLPYGTLMHPTSIGVTW